MRQIEWLGMVPFGQTQGSKYREMCQRSSVMECTLDLLSYRVVIPTRVGTLDIKAMAWVKCVGLAWTFDAESWALICRLKLYGWCCWATKMYTLVPSLERHLTTVPKGLLEPRDLCTVLTTSSVPLAQKVAVPLEQMILKLVFLFGSPEGHSRIASDYFNRSKYMLHQPHALVIGLQGRDPPPCACTTVTAWPMCPLS